MIKWKPVIGFFGSTREIEALKGKRVKTNCFLGSVNIYDPVNNRQVTTQIKKDTIGFVSNPLGPDLLIAFPKIAVPMETTLDSLLRGGNFFVVVINSPTFKRQFDIESS